MSLWNDRKREFELEVLRVQLKHHRKTSRYTAFTAVGISFFAFSLTLYATIILSVEEPSSFVTGFVSFYSAIGFLIMIVSLRRLRKLETSEAEDIERIRKKYVAW